MKSCVTVSPHSHRFCFECLNKATGERKCIVCGGNRPPPIGKMVYCEVCPRAYHHDCYIPPMAKAPRGKWYCVNCISKAPPKPKRSSAKKPKDASMTTPIVTPDVTLITTPTDIKDSSTVTEVTPIEPKSTKEGGSEKTKSSSDRSKSRKKKAKDKDREKNKEKKNKDKDQSKIIEQDTSPVQSSLAIDEITEINNTQSSTCLPTFDATDNSPPQAQQSSFPPNSDDDADMTDASIPNLIHSTPTQDAAVSQDFANLSHASMNSDSILSDTNKHDLALNNSDSINSTVTMSAKEKAKKERKATKKLIKELAVCKTILEEMEVRQLRQCFFTVKFSCKLFYSGT